MGTAPAPSRPIHPLTRARARRFWTQRDLALKAGVSEATVSRAEKGLGLGVISQERIAQALELPAEELFDTEVAS